MNFTEIALSDASNEAKIEAIGIVLDKKVQELEKISVETSLIPGPKGDKGEKGDDGKPGKDGVDGRPGINGKDGKDGVNGIDGQNGVGVEDAYIDFDNSLVIKLTDGKEINAGDLNLDNLQKELIVQSNKSSNTLFDPNSLPLASNSPTPTEIIIKQSGTWKRATWSQFTSWIGAAPTDNFILTESGNTLITESGNNLVWE